MNNPEDVIHIDADTGVITLHGLTRETDLERVKDMLGCYGCVKGHVAKEFPVLVETSKQDDNFEVTRTFRCLAITLIIVNPPGLRPACFSRPEEVVNVVNVAK